MTTPLDVANQKHLPAWLSETEQDLQALIRLPENWNSYGARTIDPQGPQAAMDLLLEIARPDTPRPLVVPTARGGVQLEWHTRGIDLEIEVQAPGRYQVFFEDSEESEAWEDELGPSDLARLAEPVARLSSPAPPNPPQQ